MSLDQHGGALISEDRISPSGTRFTVTTPYTYTISGAVITFAFVGQCMIETCSPPPTGAILDNGIHVQVVFPPESQFRVYNFRTLVRT
jgi:hypothetical protein